MLIQLLVVPDCPNREGALALLRTVLAAAGISDEPKVVVVDTAEAAKHRRFIGSPSFYADGTDLLPAGGAEPAVACRVYPKPGGGLAGLPTPSQLQAALRERVATP